MPSIHSQSETKKPRAKSKTIVFKPNKSNDIVIGFPDQISNVDHYRIDKKTIENFLIK